MDRGDVLSGAAFSAVLRSSLVFIVVLAVMGGFSVRLIDRAMTEEVQLRVLEMEHNLQLIAIESGAEALATQIAAIAYSSAGETLAYAAYRADGTRLAGNIDIRLAPGQWHEVTTTLETAGRSPGEGVEAPTRYLLHAMQIDDLVLITGRSMAILGAARISTIRAFALTGFVVILATLAIGFVLSLRSQQKLERIEQTLERVSSGDNAARIGAVEDDTQIDRISRRLDGHLAQLDVLIAGTRRTAASVAHDLRRPLARASLVLEQALARAEAGQDTRAEIEAAQADLARLTAIVATILRIARIEGGAVGALTDVDLQPILDEVAETYEAVAEDAGQRLIYHRAEEPLILRGDAEMLAQLVVNLLQNALTHAGTGARITLDARTGTDGLVLVVQDDGPGIAPDLRTRVFEPFFRTDDARTVEGSGLGLPLVKAIAERHGATVQLEDAAPGLRVRVQFAAA